MSASASLHKGSIHQHCHADVAFLNTGAPLLSIGLHTDAMLDRFGLDDKMLLKLQELIGSVHSSCWEAVLQSPKWNLTHEQVLNMSKVLHLDLDSSQSMYVVNKVWCIFGSFKFL
jgi:hypothetical protein